MSAAGTRSPSGRGTFAQVRDASTAVRQTWPLDPADCTSCCIAQPCARRALETAHTRTPISFPWARAVLRHSEQSRLSSAQTRAPSAGTSFTSPPSRPKPVCRAPRTPLPPVCSRERPDCGDHHNPSHDPNCIPNRNRRHDPKHNRRRSPNDTPPVRVLLPPLASTHRWPPTTHAFL